MSMQLVLADRQTQFNLQVATAEGLSFGFRDPAAVVEWLTDLNADIDPIASAMARQRAEALEERRLFDEAEREAVQKEISELPDTDRIQKARAIAEQLRNEADNRVRLLELAKAELEAEAARRQAAAAESEATATAEEIARAAEIAERERLAAEGGER